VLQTAVGLVLGCSESPRIFLFVPTAFGRDETVIVALLPRRRLITPTRGLLDHES
jgi:hypothetical protein